MNSALRKSVAKKHGELIHRCLGTSALRIPELCHNQMTCENGAPVSFHSDGSISNGLKTAPALLDPLGDRQQRRRHGQ